MAAAAGCDRQNVDIVPSYSENNGKLLKTMERETGIEPATNSLEG